MKLRRDGKKKAVPLLQRRPLVSVLVSTHVEVSMFSLSMVGGGELNVCEVLRPTYYNPFAGARTQYVQPRDVEKALGIHTLPAEIWRRYRYISLICEYTSAYILKYSRVDRHVGTI
jgi:hypothetical protein